MMQIRIQGPRKTVASWSDLLGFAEALSAVGWQLSTQTAKAALERLGQFSWIMGSYHSDLEEAILVNDGIVRTFTPSLYGDFVTENNNHNLLAWLTDILSTHCLVAGFESEKGLPGIRTIICEGEMMLYDDNPFSYLNDSHFEHSNLTQNKVRPNFLRPISTQLNTAFSKCFLADSLGTRIGLKNGGIYIEQSVISQIIAYHGCWLHENFLFFYRQPILNPQSKYHAVKDLYLISSKAWPDGTFLYDKTTWCRFGESLHV